MIPALADYRVVDLMQPDGQIELVAWAHIDPNEQRLFDQIADQCAPRQLDVEHPV